ncbi:MAG TPA: PAS domain S-box protein, partial [Spirochaetia bacterium]|nr:PAS domain S-box protein [Spirochaetia bacterium]
MNDPDRLAPLDLVLDSSHDFIGMADATGVVTYLNRAARAMTRLPLEGPLPPLSILDFVPGQLRDMFATIVEPALRESGHWRGREALRSPVDGQQIPIEIDVFSLGRSRDGRLSGLMTVIHEISSPRESQVAAQRNEAALQVARMGHWEFDVAERQFEFNDLYYALHGLTAEQAGGYLMSAETFTARYVHPEDAHLVTQAIQAAAESSDPDFQFQREARILRADGTTRNVMVWFRVEKDPRGRTVRLHGVNQDITERKQVEEALRKSEFFLQKSQSVARVGSYWFWPSTGTWICSPALDEIFGIDATYRKDIDGWMGIVHPDHRAEMLDHLLKHVLAGRNRFDHEYRIVRPSDGRVLWVHGLGELELDATGAPTAMIGTIQDITERRRADDALKESEERFRTTLYSIADGVVTTDVS